MKAIVLFSSFFFFLGLKIGNIIDLPGKARVAVEVGISEKLKQSTPVKSIQMFKESENETESQKEKAGNTEKNSVINKRDTEE